MKGQGVADWRGQDARLWIFQIFEVEGTIWERSPQWAIIPPESAISTPWMTLKAAKPPGELFL